MVNKILRRRLRRWSGSPEYLVRGIKYNRIRPRQWQFGVWDRVMCFWQSGMKRGAAMAVLSAALLGCSNTESLSSKAQTEFSKPTAAEDFTTKGKPKKTIETPWGPREIYDPAQDPEMLDFYLGVFKTQFYENPNRQKATSPNLHFTSEQREVFNSLVDGFNVHRLDIARIGCVKAKTPTCGLLKHYITPNCDLEDSLGRAKLTPCESENSTKLSLQLTPVMFCEYDGNKRHLNINHVVYKSAETYLEAHTSFQCEIWRGEEPPEYWKSWERDGPVRLPE